MLTQSSGLSFSGGENLKSRTRGASSLGAAFYVALGTVPYFVSTNLYYVMLLNLVCVCVL